MKKKILLLIIIILIIILGLSYLIDEKYNNYVVKIDDRKISIDEYKIYLKIAKVEMEDKYALTYGEAYKKGIWADSTKTDEVKDVAYKNIIKNNICVQKAKERNISLTEDDVTNIDLSLEDASLLKDLNKKGITKEEYKRIRQDERLIELFKESLLANVQVSKAEIDEYIKDNYKGEKTYVIKRIIFKINESENSSDITTHDKKKAYERAEFVQDEIKNGGNFTDLSIQYSDYDTSYKQGTDYNITIGKTENSALEEVALSLKVGEVSKIIETTYGYEIIRLERIIDSTSKEYREKVEKIILENKKAQEFEAEYKKWENISVIKVNKSVYNSIKV